MAKSEISCPTCGKRVACEKPGDAPFLPFCSQRCRLVDLDKWFEAEYRISEDITDASEGEDGVGERGGL